MPSPKRHHFVPRAYLARFGVDNQVQVKTRGKPNPYTTNVINVAVRSGFYTTTSPDGSTSTFTEGALAQLDDVGIQAMRDIDAKGRPPEHGSEGREILSLYLAAQMTRTPGKRTTMLFPEAVTAYAQGRALDRDLVAEYLEREHLGFAPEPAEVEGAWSYLHGVLHMHGAPTKTDAIAATLDPVTDYVRYFHDRHWRLEISRSAPFLTSDAPLVLWRPPSPEDAYKGFGLLDADQIRFPLNPQQQLVLTRGTGTAVAEVKPVRVAKCNADLADACERVVIGHPDSRLWPENVDLTGRGPTLRFNLAPGMSTGPDGHSQTMGDVIHVWTTRR
jgi:hypothetical protein